MDSGAERTPARQLAAGRLEVRAESGKLLLLLLFVKLTTHRTKWDASPRDRLSRRYLIKYYRHDLHHFEDLPLIPMKSKATPLDDSVLQAASPEKGRASPGSRISPAKGTNSPTKSRSPAPASPPKIELCPLGPPNGIVMRHFDGLNLEDLESIMDKLGVTVIGT